MIALAITTADLLFRLAPIPGNYLPIEAVRLFAPSKE
jgi:hypothetical protein